jgi:hypothetical protein
MPTESPRDEPATPDRIKAMDTELPRLDDALKRLGEKLTRASFCCPLRVFTLRPFG